MSNLSKSKQSRKSVIKRVPPELERMNILNYILIMIIHRTANRIKIKFLSETLKS